MMLESRCSINRMRETLLRIIFPLIIVSLFTACSNVSDEEILLARKAVKEGALLLDVRTPKEYKERHIQGANNLPIDILDKVYTYLPRDKPIVVYCRTGSRSEVAAKFLREQGWTVYDVATQEDWEREIKIEPK